MIVEVELNAFELIIQSRESPNKIQTSSRPTMHRIYSDRTKRCRNSEMNLASQVTGQTLFDVWGLENPRDTPPQHLVRPYKKVDIYEGTILETLETICDVCDALKNTQNTQKLRKTGFSVKNPYYDICLFAVRDYLKLFLEGKLKGEATTRSAKYYIRTLKNRSVGWFYRHIGKWGDYYIQNKELIVSLQGKNRKFSSLIDDEDILIEFMFWLLSQKPAKRTGRHFKRFIEGVILPSEPSYSKSTKYITAHLVTS